MRPDKGLIRCRRIDEHIMLYLLEYHRALDYIVVWNMCNTNDLCQTIDTFLNDRQYENVVWYSIKH